MILAVSHRTSYRYASPVSLGYSEARLLPRELPIQTSRSADLRIHPEPSDRSDHVDYFGNHVVHLAFDQPHSDLVVEAHSVVETTPLPADFLDQFADPWESCRLLPSSASGAGAHDVDYALDSPLVATSEALAEFASPSFTAGRPLVEAVVDLSHRIHSQFQYRPGSTTISTSLEHVLANREGVCQDFAHIAIGALRSVGVAAQYVSGYVETLPPDGEPRLRGVDASHAWFAVYAPEGGWLHIDPTNDQVVDDRYVVLGWGRDYADVAPLKGVVFSAGGEQSLTVEVDVARSAG